MTVKFNVVERGNPANREAPKKFYPSVASSGRKTLRQIAGRISKSPRYLVPIPWRCSKPC